jgi:AraC-like DNA-binding protein
VQIALESGYFDQAHLIRDFRQFTGRPPMSVFSNTAAAPIV